MEPTHKARAERLGFDWLGEPQVLPLELCSVELSELWELKWPVTLIITVSSRPGIELVTP